MGQISAVSKVLGRREMLRCLGIGALGAASVAVLGACGKDTASSPGTSVAAQALSAFLQGSWAISFPLDSEREAFTVQVTDAAWKVPEGPMSAEQDGGSGTWAYAGGTLQIINWKGDQSVATASGVPDQVQASTMPSTLPWTWKGTATSSTDDDLSIGLAWETSTSTMTITAKDANGEPLVIEARRS